MIPILYEDKHIIICEKPVGLVSQSDNNNAPSLVTQLSSLYPNSTIYPVHRLDREVGGVMVYARTKQAASKLSTAIANHEFTKEYYAVVEGSPAENTGTYCDLLFRDSHKNKSYVVSRMRRGVKEASLDYEAIKSTDALSLVKIRLHTGRTHQIRVQFSHRHMPLLGDRRYGSREKNCNIALWSYHIGFTHPITGEQMDFTRDVPDAYPWNLF